MSGPIVSVIVPTYNREALLPRALDSIVAQTFGDWEIVLIDDGSTDETESLAGEYARRLGSRFQYARYPNTGCGAARNHGIELAHGSYVAFLDSDDEFHPHKLERQLELFKLRPELGLVYSDYAYIDLNGTHHASVFDTLTPLGREVPSEPVAPGLFVCTSSLFDVLLRGYFIATIVGMVRREVLGDRIRFSPDPSYSAEWLFYLRVARGCRAGFVDEPLCLHHHVAGSATRTNRHRNNVRLRKLLVEMNTAFDGLTRGQRCLITCHLAATCRQLGYDSYRNAEFGPAVRHLAESFSRRPGVRSAFDLADAGFRWMWASMSRRPGYGMADKSG